MKALYPQLDPLVGGELDWGLLDGAELERAWRAVDRFVDWLRERGAVVPICWYVHPDLSAQLAALELWLRMILQPPGRPRELVEFWEWIHGRWPILYAERLARCKRGHHDDTEQRSDPPSFDDWVARCVAQSAPWAGADTA
jgi:hypothetical protein